MTRRFSTIPIPPNDLGIDASPFPVLVQIGEDLWILFEPFSYTDDDDVTYMAARGMTTDMASIPRELWSIMPPFGKYTGAAVIHDMLYQTQMVSKEKADHLLADMMDLAGVPHMERMAIYDGVKFGGQPAWDAHTAELQKKKG